jgi:hypothetical protein
MARGVSDKKRNRRSGAARTMSSHISKQGLKGNRTPGTKRSSSDAAASQRVGGYAGANFG